MHVEQVWGAGSKVKILRTLAQPSLPQLDAGQLAAETGLSTAGVRKALRDLASTGVIAPVGRGRITFYALNADHSMTPSIIEAFRAETLNQGVEHLMPTFWNHLVQFVDRITERDGVLFVLLFGSVTKPPVYPGADVDILVGLDPAELAPTGERYSRRQRRLVSDFRTDKTDLEALDADIMGHPVHVVTLSVADFEDKMRQQDPFVEGVLQRNVVLYQDANYQLPLRHATPPAVSGRSWASNPWRSWGNRGGW